MLASVALWLLAGPAVRLPGNPMVTPASSVTLGDNINGPSLIRAPKWLAHPLGRYYLYFAHHQGRFIRLAYADKLEGPWKIYVPGTLRLEKTPVCHDHVASPDVHVDDVAHKILMYFHCPTRGEGKDISDQVTLLASSDDGANFTASPQLLGPAYFRVFEWQGYYYAIGRGGTIFRSKDGVNRFEPGPQLFPKSGPLPRHVAVLVQGDVLSIYYSRIGDRPEEILVAQVQLGPDWKEWKASSPQPVLAPEFKYEGTDLPLEASHSGELEGRARQLRDPAIYEEDGRVYLIYSVAGESGLGIAEIK